MVLAHSPGTSAGAFSVKIQSPVQTAGGPIFVIRIGPGIRVQVTGRALADAGDFSRLSYMKIAVCVPTIRPEKFRDEFLPAWDELFRHHAVNLFVVHDGERPQVERYIFQRAYSVLSASPAPCQISEVYPALYNFSDVCRNAAFYAAQKFYKPDIFISLDDDVTPVADPIQAHMDALSDSVELDWVNTARFVRMRGLPYRLKKYPVLLSHGVWNGVPDMDAVTQLRHPELRDVLCERFTVPRGAFFPVCAMNFAFRKELLPYAYQAPMGQRLQDDEMPPYDRFGDIWAGVVMKHAIDTILNGAAVSGYATVHHDRASDVFTNLRKEAPGMELNETFHEEVQRGLHNSANPYCQLYAKRLQEWKNLL